MSEAGWTFKGYHDKRSALWAFAMMYQWLSVTGGTREEYLNLLDLLGSQEINVGCAACKWVSLNGIGCEECFMKRVWDATGLCIGSESPDERKHYARMIYEGARDLLLEEIEMQKDRR